MTDTATPTAAPSVEPTAPTPTEQLVAEPVKTEPQQTTKTEPAKTPEKVAAKEPAKMVSLLDEPAPVETKPPADTDPTKVPDKYEWKLPEGQSLSPELSDTFSELAKSANLPQAKAQEYLDRLTAGLETQNQAKLVEWINKAAEDTRTAEGDQFEANRAKVSRALKTYGGEELDALLKTPLGLLMVNNKAMWGFLTKLGADVSDDAAVTGRRTAVSPELTDEEFYKAIRPK